MKIQIGDVISVSCFLSTLKITQRINVLLVKQSLSQDMYKAFCKLQPVSAFGKFLSKRNVDKAIKVLERLLDESETDITLSLRQSVSLFDEIQQREKELDELLVKVGQCRFRNEDRTASVLNERFALPNCLVAASKRNIITNHIRKFFRVREGVDLFELSPRVFTFDYSIWRHDLDSLESSRYREAKRTIVNRYGSGDFIILEQCSKIRLESLFLCTKDQFIYLINSFSDGLNSGEMKETLHDLFDYLEFVERCLGRLNHQLRYCQTSLVRLLNGLQERTPPPPIEAKDALSLLLGVAAEVTDRDYLNMWTTPKGLIDPKLIK